MVEPVNHGYRNLVGSPSGSTEGTWCTVWQIDMLEERRRSMSIRLYGLDQHWTDAAFDELDEIAALTRDAIGVDGAAINLLVDDRQVTVGTANGEPIEPVSRDESICSTVLRDHPGPELIEITDTQAVPELVGNPFVDGRFADLRFYAAAPLVGKHGLTLGTLCVWSLQPSDLDARQRALLRQFGRAVVNVLDERRRALVPDKAALQRPAR